jgi:hypothetical protein
MGWMGGGCCIVELQVRYLIYCSVLAASATPTRCFRWKSHKNYCIQLRIRVLLQVQVRTCTCTRVQVRRFEHRQRNERRGNHHPNYTEEIKDLLVVHKQYVQCCE